MRLQKYIASCGLCSRREAENWLRAGRVTINGRVAVLGESTDDPEDIVCVDGKQLRLPPEHTYVMLHKPRGYVTTLRDERGRPSVAELVTDAGVRLFPVGRLDLMSEGLLVLTDDGDAANRLAHPSGGVEKTYRVWVKGRDLPEAAETLRHPIQYRGESYRGARVDILTASEEDGVLDMTIKEGKNREIRNMCASVGLRVKRLLRIRQGELELDDLPSGQWRYLTENEIQYLHHI